MGGFFIDIFRLTYLFGLASCMWRDMGIVHPMVAAGLHENPYEKDLVVPRSVA